MCKKIMKNEIVAKMGKMTTINMPAECNLSSLTVVIMFWHVSFSLFLSLSLQLLHSSILPPSLCLCINIDIAWYHCCIHAFVIELPNF